MHIKLGGDAGGGSFKMAFQIANLRHPNSKTNTVVFAMFHAKDSWANLKTALMKYKEQVNTLKEATWVSKKIYTSLLVSLENRDLKNNIN